MTAQACKVIRCTQKAQSSCDTVLRVVRDVEKDPQLTKDVVYCMEKFDADMAAIFAKLTDGWDDRA